MTHEYDDIIHLPHPVSAFIAPDESTQKELDQKMAYLLAHISEQPSVTITYFVPDKRKEGGSYPTKEERLVKYDEYKQEIQMGDGTRIPIRSIVNIEGISL